MAKMRKPMPDRHTLYQRAVQAPDAEVDFADQAFRRFRGRRAVTMREDVCGTAEISCEWVKRRRTNRAIGLDLDQPTLDWGLGHNVAKLSAEQQGRLKLYRRNVLKPGREGSGVDLVLAMNFSYWIFKERAKMLAYFKAVRKSLGRQGLFILDIYGGPDAIDEVTERRPIRGKSKGGFTYIWEQERFDPITNETLCHIHFRLNDGRSIRKAFTYDWRVWTIPEIRDILDDAGFKRTTVFWEGDDAKGGGDGEFKPKQHGDSCAAFIAYIVAER